MSGDEKTLGSLVYTPVVVWPDGLRVQRVAVIRDQIVLWIEWQGRCSTVRLGKRTREIEAAPTRDRKS